MQEKLICRLNDEKSVYAAIGISPIVDPKCFYFFYCHPDGTVKDAHINKITYTDVFTEIYDRLSFFIKVRNELNEEADKNLANLILCIIEVHEKYAEIRKFVEDNFVEDAHVGIFLK